MLAGAFAAVLPTVAADQLVIRCEVVDLSAAPLAGVEVNLIPAKDDGSPNSALPPTRMKSDKKGRLTFGFAKPGRYLLRATTAGAVLVEFKMKMRDQNKKVPLMPDGQVLNDMTARVDPSKPELQFAIPSQVFTVDITLVMGQPVASAPRAEAPAALPPQEQLDMKQATEAIQAGRFAEGLALVEKALVEKPSLAEEQALAVSYLKGYALANLDRPNEAEPEIRKALAIDPSLPGGFRLLAKALLAQRKFPEAIEALGSALTAAADDTNQRGALLFLRGQAFAEVGKAAEAVTDLEEARRISPTDSSVLVQLINAYTLAGREADADALIAPDLPARDAAVLHYNLAVDLIQKNRNDDAARHLRKSLELQPSMIDTHKVLADVLLALKKRDEAIKELEAYLAAANNAPDSAEIKKLIQAIKTQK